MRRRSFIVLALGILAGPLLAPAGRSAETGLIAYARKNGDRFQLHVMKADGTDDHLLGGQSAAIHLFPVWSPDGKKIACMTGEKIQGDDFQITILNADGSGGKPFNFT